MIRYRRKSLQGYKVCVSKSIQQDAVFPGSNCAKDDTDKAHPVPQVIGHRGFKGKHPENSISAFKGAVQVGGDAIELDLALSKDNVVVISHVCLGISISNAIW